jgi:hypothetical protein
LLTEIAKSEDKHLNLLLPNLNAETLMSALFASVPDDYLLSAPLPTRTMAAQRGGVGVISAVQLLAALYRQSLRLRSEKVFRDTDVIAERAMKIIEGSPHETLAKFIEDLMLQCVIVPHLTTTLRKMGSGQQCSLRFFPDGELFRSTAIQVSAGRSGTRLANVLGILSDLSVLDLTGDVYTPGKQSFHEA